MSRNNPSNFSFSETRFKMQPSKMGTGRIVFRKYGLSP